jgi:hypothetical protein
LSKYVPKRKINFSQIAINHEAFRNVSRCPVLRIHHSSVLRPSVDGSVTEGEKGAKRRGGEEAKRRRDEEARERGGERARGLAVQSTINNQQSTITGVSIQFFSADNPGDLMSKCESAEKSLNVRCTAFIIHHSSFIIHHSSFKIHLTRIPRSSRSWGSSSIAILATS